MQAIASYLRQHGDSEAVMLDAAELKLRAERRLGELLAETVVQGSHNTMLPDGVEPMDSSRWQRIATIPEETFEQHVAERREAGELTTAELKLRAERRLGELLAESVVRGKGNKTLPFGIGKMDSSRWQRIASLPEETFEDYPARSSPGASPRGRGKQVSPIAAFDEGSGKPTRTGQAGRVWRCIRAIDPASPRGRGKQASGVH